MTLVNKITSHIHKMGSEKSDINTEKTTYTENNQRFIILLSMLGLHWVFSNIG